MHQKIQVLNLTNGNRLETYLIDGPAAAASSSSTAPPRTSPMVGDRVIVAGFAFYTDAESANHHPKVLVLNERNEVIDRH